MKKKMYAAVAAVLACLLLAGCCMSHEWQEASCETPKSCAKCGKTEGETLGHDWKITCEAPETCARCGQTRGEAPGHSWVEATCVTPKTCTACGAVEGEALGHTAETGKIVERGPAHYHVGICSVCGEEFEDFLENDSEKIVRGSWSGVSMKPMGQDVALADGQVFMELAEDGSAVLVKDGEILKGSWRMSGYVSSNDEMAPLEEKGEEQIWDAYIEMKFAGECHAFLNGYDTNSMNLKGTIGGDYTEIRFRRGSTEAGQAFLDDLAAKEALAKETLVGKWELRAVTASGKVVDTAANNIQASEEFSQDGGVKHTQSVEGEEYTLTGTWEYLGARKNGDMDVMDFLLTMINENGEAHKEMRVLWFLDEDMVASLGGLVDDGPVLLSPTSGVNFVLDKVSD